MQLVKNKDASKGTKVTIEEVCKEKEGFSGVDDLSVYFYNQDEVVQASTGWSYSCHFCLLLVGGEGIGNVKRALGSIRIAKQATEDRGES